MEVGDEQKREEIAKKLSQCSRLVKMDFRKFSVFLHGGGR